MIRQLAEPDLSLVPALQALPPEALGRLAALGRLYYLEPGEVLLHQGDLIHSFYIVLNGGVRLVEYTGGGQSVSLKIYGPGDLFGLLAISGSYPHPTQIEAIHYSEIAAIPGAETRRLMRECPDLALVVLDLLTAHVHHAHHRIREMATERVDRRLARTLLHLSAKFGVESDGVLSIDVPLTQRDLAEFAGTTVETINRALKLWSRRGIVRCGHKHLDVLDRPALAAIAEGAEL